MTQTGGKAFLYLVVGAFMLTSAAGAGVYANELQRRYVRVAQIEIDRAQLDSYKAIAKEQIETAIRVEPGVLTLYAVAEQDDPTRVVVFEIYADRQAYRAHIETPHFKKYKADRSSLSTRFPSSSAQRRSDRSVAEGGMSKFDAKTLCDLHEAHEVAIRTEKHPDAVVVIWVAVVDDEAFVRSFRGARGRWYRDLAAGGPATLELGGRRLAVEAVPANDAATIARASREYLRKYGSSPYAQAMVKPDILSTTLRLEPR